MDIDRTLTITRSTIAAALIAAAMWSAQPATAAPAPIDTPTTSRIAAIAKECGEHTDGNIITITATRATLPRVGCVIVASRIDMPAIEHIEANRLRGLQRDSWNGYSARWSWTSPTSITFTITE